MAGQQALTKIERIVAARYGPLVLPTPMNAMHAGEYQEFIPKFTGTEGVRAEEHLESFYNYADNLNIYEEDVWMRVFVQSLDGEARKWFNKLVPRSIVDIEALDDVFLKHWGDDEVLLYEHIEFGNLQRDESSSSSDLEIDKLAKMIELLAFEVSKLKAEQYSKEVGAPCSFTLPKPNSYRGAQEQL